MKRFLVTSTLVLLIIIPVFLIRVPAAAAQGYTFEKYDTGWTIIPPECLGSQQPGEKQCGLNSFVQLFINLAYLALKILPYLAVLMIIVGGFVLLSSGGSAERVQQGKRMITSVIVGVIIVLVLGWGLSAMTVYLLTGNSKGVLFTDYGAPWQKEWWGGQDNAQQTPTTGCCFVSRTTSIGCLSDATEVDCAARDGFYAGNGSLCSTYVNPQVGGCTKYKATGCCTKIENNITSCQPATDISGCTAYRGYEYTDTSCANLVGPGCGRQ